MSGSSCKATATKKVQPKERILNDDVAGVDYLGHTVYAEALAQTIKSVNPPITVGVYGRWGSGKTFLIKEVCNILKREQKQRMAATTDEMYPMSGQRFFSPVIVLALIGLSLLAAGVILVIPTAFSQHALSSTVQTTAAAGSAHPKTLTVRQAVGIAALVLACVVALASFFFFFMHDAYPPDQGVLSNLKLLLVALLARLPIASEQRGFVRGDQESYRLEFQESTASISSLPGQKQVKYMFVDFNAWACTGTDNLWAGIAIALANAVELEFGKVTTRLSRMFQIDKIPVEGTTGDAPKCLFVNLGCHEDIAQNVLQVYGPTDIFQTYSDWKQQTSGTIQQSCSSSVSGWWYVSFRFSLDALNALECLSKKGVEITKKDPFAQEKKEHTATGETHALLKESKDDYASSESSSDTKGFCYLLRNYPKTACGVPVLFWLVMTAFVVLIPIPLIIYANVTSSSIPAFVQVFAWVPAAAAGIYAGVKFLYAMCNSQISRIYSMLGGTKGNLSAQLGVMNNIKLEIQHITSLVQCAETTHNIVYKFLIVIDDLDKIQLSTVKSVLDAVSILLSDRLSPFICLTSINSRVAVESIEQAFNITKTEANVNARLYLRKIINLPFCVPRAHKKKQYIGGLIDQTDVVVNRPKVLKSQPPEESNQLTILKRGPPEAYGFKSFHTEELDSKRFLFECRQYYHAETLVQRHLEENPRLIKRIFNIITLTAIVINRCEDEEQRQAYVESVTGGSDFVHVKGIRTKALAKDLVRWIILTEQWPFRTSYILQIIKDADRREEADKNDPQAIANDESLIKIYETRVQPELAAVASSSMTRIDGDAELFHSFLHELKGDGMTKSKALLLQNYMINLDHGVGHYIEELRPMKALAATDLLNRTPTPAAAASAAVATSSARCKHGQRKMSISRLYVNNSELPLELRQTESL